MKELFCNKLMLSNPGISDDLGIIHYPYRASSFAQYPSSGHSSTRGYLLTVAGKLLPVTAIEIAGRESSNSQGRAAKPGSCKGSGTARQALPLSADHNTNILLTQVKA
jgi:hypothetical protein